MRSRAIYSYAVTADLSVERVGDGVSLLTLRRPERLNALTWALIDALREVIADIGRDDGCRVLVLTGEGRGFCSGLDLKEEPDALGETRTMVDVLRRQERVAELATALHGLQQPVVAAVNGPAAGGGLALALAANVRLGATSASFVASFVRLGLSACDVGVSYFLPRIVGLGMASELMLTGRKVEANEALRIGLVSRIVEEGTLREEALAIAAQIASNSPFGVTMTKRVLALNVDAASLHAAIELENRTQVLATRTEDMSEALSAFREKRAPRFAGR